MGRLVTFESHFDRFRPLQREGTWKEAASAANGMLFDLGPHLVDQALALFGAPKTITASVRKDRDVTEIEDAFDITLEYDRLRVLVLPVEHAGVRRCAAVSAAWDARELQEVRAGSAGAGAGGRGEGAADGRAEVWLQERGGAWGTLTVAPVLADPGTLMQTGVKTELGDYRGFYANVRDAINGTAELAVSAEDGFQVIRLLELARESSLEGHTAARCVLNHSSRSWP